MDMIGIVSFEKMDEIKRTCGIIWLKSIKINRNS